MRNGQTIIIKKVKKQAHAHHGGAWKVAYADFVTAMMAFFLLLWLLNAVTQEQLEGISDYFSPISKHTATSGGGGLLQGEIIAANGVFNGERKDKPRTEARQPHADAPGKATADADETDADRTADEDAVIGSENEGDRASRAAGQHSETLAEERNDDALFAQAESAVKQAFDAHPELKPLANSLMMENTPEGLRIQIVDQDGLPMFPRGQAVMYQYTRRVLEIVSSAIRHMPQLIEIAGHTDSTPFASGATYSNWELSADRANAARRVLLETGLGEDRIDRVVGRAATDPLLPRNPEAAGNRRLTITLLRGTTAS